MTVKELTAQALRLPARDRARLVEALLATLDEEPDQAVLRAWLDEALRRRRELESTPSQGTPASQVFREADARLR